MRRKTNATKKRGNVVGAAAGASGAGSVISAHNVCHAICLAVVSLLSVFGIIVSSDILMWLQDYNMLFWGMGLAFLFVSNRYTSYNRAISSELPDKCATPEGYTDQQWRDHMCHHPDRYAECLHSTK